MKCRLCGRDLHRVNEKGATGIWECRPYCLTDISPDEAVVMAIAEEQTAKKEGES